MYQPAMPKKFEADEEVDDRQDAEQPEIEDELLGKGKGYRGKPAVQVASVMLYVNPVEALEVEGAVRGVVPDLGPDRGEEGGREERSDTGVPEATKQQEAGEDDGVKRRVNRVAKFPTDLVAGDREVVNYSARDRPLPRDRKIPEERHCMTEDCDDEEDDDRRGAHPSRLSQLTAVPGTGRLGLDEGLEIVPRAALPRELLTGSD